MNRWTKDTTIGFIVFLTAVAIVGLLIWGFITWINSWPDPMSNDDIIRETKKCQDAGLYPSHQSDWGFNTVRITCVNKSA